MTAIMTPEGLMYRVHGAGEGKSTSVLLELNMAARVAVQVWYVEQAGGDLYLNEGNRPRGVPSDRNVRRASDTKSGESTQYFQHGRFLRGETPSAINPDVRDSNHTGGRALDSNAPTARDMKLRAEGAYLAGLVFNVPSESWHQEPLASPRVDLAPWLESIQGVVTPTAPAPSPKLDFQEEAMYVVFVDGLGNYLITPTFVRKIVDLPDASAKDTIAGIEKLSKAKIVLPFGEFYGIWSNINAGTKDDSSTGREIQALAKQLAAKS